jgi:diguanylate cyclase (GGDEF)-like protein
MPNQPPNLLSRVSMWRREIADSLVLYSISILACAATFYSKLFENYVNFSRAQDGLGAEKITIISLFLGIASAAFGARRLTDQRNERIRRLAAEQQAASLSLRDPLTLLPNRRCLENEVGAAIERVGSKITVFLVGLKRFELINNVHGHAGGDAVLSQVAARMRQGLGGIGFLARVGDDEFAVMTSGEEADKATRIALNLVENIRQPVQIGMSDHSIEAHVGIAQLTSEQRSVGEVLRRAHVALDRARNLDTECCFFDVEMDAHICARVLLEQDLRSALRSDAIHLYYQPIVDLQSGKIVSFEALARWKHPERGFISPEIFIPLTEDLGLMDCLSGQMFGDACRQALSWPEDISLSFNFSPGQLADPAFGDAVLTVLGETGFPPHRLEAEITEGALVSDFVIARQVLQTLRSAGVRIVMDDFGTGYSSLRHLHELRFNKIKIDRSFVSELSVNAECAAIVSAVAGLGRSLSIDTVAEGIETQDQLVLVRSAGCTHAQGYLLARPCPASEIDFTPVGTRNPNFPHLGADLPCRRHDPITTTHDPQRRDMRIARA